METSSSSSSSCRESETGAERFQGETKLFVLAAETSWPLEPERTSLLSCCFPAIMEEEFQFLLCEGCQKESKNPKLLSCLHTLCTDCLQENKPIGQCPICEAPISQARGIPEQDNLLYTSLQWKLNIYKKIVTGIDLVCDCCQEEAQFRCSECQEFFCSKCFENHQWFFKKNSHEIQKVSEVRVGSAAQFLEEERRSSNLYCSSLTHRNQSQITSIYCQGCNRPLCCSCALLDNEHTKLYCDIEKEIQRRQEELMSMSEELKQKKNCYESAYNSLQSKADQMDQVWKETQELILEKVEEMVKLIRDKGEELLKRAEKQHHEGHQDLKGKVQHMKAMLMKMEAGQQLVEKMHLYASDQEVMDMHPFIKKSLEELQKQPPLTTAIKIQVGDFSECKAELQALVEQVTGKRDAASCDAQAAVATEMSAAHNTEEAFIQPRTQAIPLPLFTITLGEPQTGVVPSITSPGKRKINQVEKDSQTSSPKVLKLESEDKWLESMPRKLDQDLPERDPTPGPSSSTLKRNCRERSTTKIDGFPSSSEHAYSEPGDQEAASIIISSSEDTDDDTVDTSDYNSLVTHTAWSLENKKSP
ncbi:protein PML [Alligator sinensis]|uniref:Protein PML n=1 Tax=Alligator sinensis TaxID=38654 RepID=A0A1U7RHY0_ALLSI|nr:protein PML [Alligator sinensis]